ncbi:5'-3' exoribonuclease 2 [Dendrobium catenatum]|uniref:5'-3' exoribonuclease 2 n=1 Tax=Dendrobium catenatum TaxID=906689 RepID=A0A2I0WR25_9ASPA|nr:5'-3' exoribonuclease 2 [Dendrobium catenatum]
MLSLFGFYLNFINLIKNYIESPYFSIMVNGKSHSFFKASHGLRQGDPISPALSLLCKCLASFFSSFQLISGLSINKDKSNFITGSSVSITRVKGIKRVCGFNQSSLPIKYLGTPLFKGRKKIFLFDNIFTIFQKKIS